MTSISTSRSSLTKRDTSTAVLAGRVEPTYSRRTRLTSRTSATPRSGLTNRALDASATRHRAVGEPGTTKTGEGRSFPLIPELRAILDRRRNVTTRCERAQTRVIPVVFHRRGQEIRSLRRAWRTACRKAGVPALIFHDLRRSAIRNLERAGIPQSTAMELTGHRTPAVYRRYAIKDEAVLREAGTKLTAWFSDTNRRLLSDNRRGQSVTALGRGRASD